MNTEGQLGSGNTFDAKLPTKIDALEGYMICHFACGARHTLACSQDGFVYSWGCNENGRLGLGHSERNIRVPAKVTQGPAEVIFVAAGEAHSASITKASEVFMWGAGSYGRLGL